MPDMFTVVGAVWEFIPDSDESDPYLGVLSAVTGKFVANVSATTALSVDDGAGVMYLSPVEFTVLSDGQISADGENPGVPLVADDATFGLPRPLRWSLVVDPFTLDGDVIEPPVTWVDADFDDEAEVSLGLWEPGPEVWPVRVARGPRGLRGHTGATGAPGGSDIELDTSPRLGGNLDLNTYRVGGANAADLTKLAAVTSTAVELSYTDGVTSAIQTQLNGKASAAQGALADSATQPGDLAAVATSGDYADLSGTPTVVDELADLDTTVTGSELDALAAGAQLTSEKGQTGGYASLDGGGAVPYDELPADLAEITSSLASKIQSGQNMVLDGGFENAYVWQYSGGTGPRERSTDQKRSGAASYKFGPMAGATAYVYLNTDNTTSTTYLEQSWPTSEGRVYYVEAWVFPDSGNTGSTGHVRLNGLFLNTQTAAQQFDVAGQTNCSALTKGQWQKISGYLTAPADVDGFGLFFRVDSTADAGDVYYIDDAYCVDVTDAYSKVDLASAQTVENKRVTPRVGTTASSATPAIDTDAVDNFTITALAANITSMSSGLSGTPTDGQRLTVRIKDDGTGRTIAWGASWRAVGVTLPATTVANKTVYVSAAYNTADSKWDAISVAEEA